MSEPVRVQVKMRVFSAYGERYLERRGRDNVLADWAATGKTPDGIEISAVTWDNYRRKKGERTAETPDQIERARTSLHLADLYQAKKPENRAMRDREALRQPLPAPVRRRSEKPSRRKRKKAANRAKKGARKPAKSRAHPAAENRVAAHRKKQRRVGIPRHRKDKGKAKARGTGRRASAGRKRSGKGKA